MSVLFMKVCDHYYLNESFVQMVNFGIVCVVLVSYMGSTLRMKKMPMTFYKNVHSIKFSSHFSGGNVA